MLLSIDNPASPAPAITGNCPPWIFAESFASTWLDLRNGKCAPPVIVWMPRGRHVIRPLGASAPVSWEVHSRIAKIANRHLAEMKARASAGQAQQPFIDFNHQGVLAGDPQEFFWDGTRGVCLLVKWLDAADRAIVRGDCDGFSPAWVRSGDDFLGLRVCVGGLLPRSETSAFGVRMPRLLPIQKLVALETRADTFLRKVDGHTVELRNAGQSNIPALQAFESVKRDWPELHHAYELRQAVREEFRKNQA